MLSRVLFAILAGAVFVGLPAAEAAAQRVIYQQPEETPQMGPVTVSNEPRHDPDRVRMWGQFNIGVPLFYDVDPDVVRPGANLQLRGGVLKNFFGGFFHFGTSWNPIDLNQVEGWLGYGREPLNRLYFGIGGRLMYAEGKIRPYVDLSFDFNWWHFLETSVGCGWWYCSAYNEYRFTPGWSGRAGFQIAVNPTLGIDLGATFAFSYAGDFFDRAQYWLEPSIGVTFFR